MPRIAGVNIPENKRIEVSLLHVYGIGRTLAQQILRTADINVSKKTKDLTSEEVARLRDIVEKGHKVEGELRREILMNVKRLKDIGSYRGIRHIRRLPVRGQRTRTNSRTVRGNVRKTVGSGKKKAAEKT
ncbi:MAG: 30S ribosomal protein S13 [Parcubacteria group bacterium]|nr:30S ribosomal protein S13 [Parcubacteria group bacterium]